MADVITEVSEILTYTMFPTALILFLQFSLKTLPVHRSFTLTRICKGNTSWPSMNCCTRRQNGFSQWRVRSRSNWFILPGTYWRNEAPPGPDDHAAKWLNTNIRGSYTRDGRWRSVRPPSRWLPWRGSIYELHCLLRALIVFSLRIPRSSSTPDGKLSRPDLACRLWNSSVSFSSRGYFLLPLLWNFFLFFSLSFSLYFLFDASFFPSSFVSFFAHELFRVYSSGLRLYLLAGSFEKLAPIARIACIVRWLLVRGVAASIVRTDARAFVSCFALYDFQSISRFYILICNLDLNHSYFILIRIRISCAK